MTLRFKILILGVSFLFYSCGDDSSNNSPADVPDEPTSSEESELLSSSSKIVSEKTESSSSVKTDVSSSSEGNSSSSVKTDVSSSSEGNSSSSVKTDASSSSEGNSSSSVKADVSSSSEGNSSSSAKEISSSSLVTTGICKTKLKDYCTYDSLYDDRDGQVYKTVKIGEQWWMAENLRYEDTLESKCFKDNPDNCLVYGKLYTRDGAINDCPNGWHLPTEKEWLNLYTYVKRNIGKEEHAGQHLRADTLWDVSGLGVGYDAFGFAALPGGAHDRLANWYGLHTHALFWSDGSWMNGSILCFLSTIIRYRVQKDLALGVSDMKLGITGSYCDQYSTNLYSVRCIKD